MLQVVQKQSVSGQFLFKKEKFIGIEVLLTPKNKKNEGLDLRELVLKSGSEEYKVQSIRPYGFNSQPTSFLKLRKPKKRAFYAIVEKDFKQGAFYYKGSKLFDVEVKTDSKIGKLKL